MKADTVFRGCSRPPMFFGVPMGPFLLAFGAVTMIAIYANLLYYILFPIIMMVLKELTKKDEFIFDLLGLHIKTKIVCFKCIKTKDKSVMVLPTELYHSRFNTRNDDQ